MRLFLFRLRGDDRLLALTYRGETRVWDTGLRDTSPVAGASLLPDATWADRDQEAWGRLILERRQDGEPLLLSPHDCGHEPKAPGHPMCVPCMDSELADLLTRS